MAWIRYLPEDEIPPEHRTDDEDNILRIHSVHPEVMSLHEDLYRELMRGPGPLTPRRREMVAVVVSSINGCRY